MNAVYQGLRIIGRQVADFIFELRQIGHNVQSFATVQVAGVKSGVGDVIIAVPVAGFSNLRLQPSDLIDQVNGQVNGVDGGWRQARMSLKAGTADFLSGLALVGGDNLHQCRLADNAAARFW